MARDMTTNDAPSAMQRKAGAGRPPPEIGAPTAAKILRGAIMQAGDDVVGLTIVAGAPDVGRSTIEPVVEAIPDNALMALIEGPGGRFGLMVLDADAVAALIEVQTTGRVVPRAADPRAPTRTDAIMCADFIDRVLELLDERAQEAELDLAPALTGYRYAVALAEKRAVTMTMDDIPYRRFTATLDLAGGAKQGVLTLVLPFRAAPGAGAAGDDPAAFSAALAEVVMETEAQVSATLHRFEMPLEAVAALTVGSLIPIPPEALGMVALEGVDGNEVMQGRLGMAGGQRAIRIGAAEAAGAAPAFAAPPPDIGMGVPEVEALDMGATPPPQPDAAGLADLGDLGDMGDLADLGDLGGGANELPDLPDLPDIGDLPDLADLGGSPDLPDLPDLSEFSEPA